MKKWNAAEIQVLNIGETENGLYGWGYDGFFGHSRRRRHPLSPFAPIVRVEPVAPADPVEPADPAATDQLS